MRNNRDSNIKIVNLGFTWIQYHNPRAQIAFQNDKRVTKDIYMLTIIQMLSKYQMVWIALRGSIEIEKSQNSNIDHDSNIKTSNFQITSKPNKKKMGTISKIAFPRGIKMKKTCKGNLKVGHNSNLFKYQTSRSHIAYQ